MILLGIFIGAAIGAVLDGYSGALAGGFIGFIVAMVLRPQIPRRTAVPATVVDGGNPDLALRLAAIESRLARLEAKLDASAEPAPAVLPPAAIEAAQEPVVDAAPAAARPAEYQTAGIEVARVSSAILSPSPAPAAETDPLASPIDLSQSPAPVAETGQVDTPATSSPSRAPATRALWAWFTGGNTLARVGVLVLFFGVAFLLRYFAEIVTIPIEAKLVAVAVAGGALIVLGAWLARTRSGYGLSLQGAGAGILYLTTFAALRMYEVLPTLPAFVLLVLVAVLTATLALRADSQPLAGLAIAGGFLAPLLAVADGGQPAPVFGYFLILNAVIFALAWVRAWRVLNVLGFVFTFVLGLYWGEQFYRPEHFATVEPFLVAFFVFYLTIAVLYAAKAPLRTKAPVDALLVFGVPLAAIALQTELVGDIEHAMMWSALALAAVYAVLALVLYRRPEPGLVLLARSFLALAIVFATCAIAYGAQARWTSALWALEAAAVYWIGCVQRQPLVRGFALLLQLGAAAAFAWGDAESASRLFFNATFLGTALIAFAAFATSFVADRHPDKITANERMLIGWLLLWGLAWWYGGAADELMRAMPRQAAPNAMLAFATATTASALLLARWLRWPRIAWIGAALLPAMAAVGWIDWERMRTTLVAAGWLIWPLAWAAHWCTLHSLEFLRTGVPAGTPGGVDATTSELQQRAHARIAHTGSAIALIAWIVWEASEWTGRVMPRGTVWMACAAAWPAIVYLGLMARSDRWRAWPFGRHRQAYAAGAATTVAAFLGVWFALANVTSPGDVDPLPYLPLANPLDLTLIAVLVVMFAWARRILAIDERPLYGWWGLAVFLLLNAIVFRTAHQWLDIAWSIPKLLASRPLQAALTLTWTATALPLMLVANKRSIRPLWMVGAGLLGVVVGKLFLVDLAALSGLTRVVAFLGVGVLLLLIGYLTPLPPTARAKD